MNTIGYDELDCPVVAGQYAHKDRLVDVGASQISVWNSAPHVRFTLNYTYDNRYSLGEPVEEASSS
jgi:hypothetical protein